MAIRLRVVDGQLVALCAARSIEKPGDVYLDDNAHHALMNKFCLDLNASLLWDTSEGPTLPFDIEQARRIHYGESDNPARKWWDSEYGRDHQLNLYFEGILAVNDFADALPDQPAE